MITVFKIPALIQRSHMEKRDGDCAVKLRGRIGIEVFDLDLGVEKEGKECGDGDGVQHGTRFLLLFYFLFFFSWLFVGRIMVCFVRKEGKQVPRKAAQKPGFENTPNTSGQKVSGNRDPALLYIYIYIFTLTFMDRR